MLGLKMEINKIEFEEKVNDLLKNECVSRAIISNPIIKSVKYKKIVLENKVNHFMMNSYTQKQSFTNNLDVKEAIEQIISSIYEYKQINIFTCEFEYMAKITKSNKIFLTRRKLDADFQITGNNNRVKNYIFKENEIIAPLIDMGIYTANGKIVDSMYDKYKQINRFIELIDDYMKNNNLKKINIVDFGCGKSYLTFVVYYYVKL